VDAPLALYRRYRPETFAEVLGQDHVTRPLRQALATNRVHHAYLFSGPRGCGKTTSARILARVLNCEKFPVDEPCGQCQSCRDLALGGPGSLDVIEIDAASHGGVDDTRELRERAAFAPMNSRFKVYVIDEAHMVSPQGFNALLKVVEEPPAHVKFVFATTEPDKVIGTIRSRTHHYPFRLLPPRLLADYLSRICTLEGIDIAPQALPLVVRAGGGSARDSLSVLDQLIGGAGPEGVTYDLATALLGYTPETLLDAVVDAFAAGDGAGVFTLVDQVVEGGREPRRFVEDLLQRLRDLLILAHVPDAGESLLDVSVDHAQRLSGQAARFGPSDLVRAAEVVATTLVDLRGPTAPRLLLEIMCARVLLPAADDGAEGVPARLDRLERRVSVAGQVAPTEPAADAVPAATTAGPAAGTQQPVTVAPAASVEPGADPEPAAPGPATEPSARPAPVPAAPAPVTAPAPTGGAAVGNDLHKVRTLWPDVLDALRSSRYVWSLLTQQVQVVAARPGVVTLGFRTKQNLDNLRQPDRLAAVTNALDKVLGGEWTVEMLVDPSAGDSGTGATATPSPPTATAEPAPPTAPDASAAFVAAEDPKQLLARHLGATVIDQRGRRR